MPDRYRLIFRPLLLLAVALPLGWLIARGLEVLGPGLGANPVRETLHFTGKTALNLLLLTLLVSPLREWFRSPLLLRTRRTRQHRTAPSRSAHPNMRAGPGSFAERFARGPDPLPCPTGGTHP